MTLIKQLQKKMAVSVSNCVNFQNTAKKIETSTGKCHRFIPNIPQEFDCRVKANIKPESLNKDLVIKDEEFKTSYFGDYPRKIVMPEQLYRPQNYAYIGYMRNVEEKLLTDPPPPIDEQLSEMKDSYRINYVKPNFPENKAPCEVAKCYISKLGCEQQPPVLPHRRGFWKWTDPYLTVYKSKYVPYDQVDDKISEKILTFYNVPEFDLPPGSGNKTMFDRCTFQNVLPVRLLARPQNRVSNYGMQSEYQDHYIKQTYSYLHPHLQDRCTVLDDSLPPASRWQNLAPPGMYCSEYCNIGGLSVRRIVDQGAPKKEMTRAENCCRI